MSAARTLILVAVILAGCGGKVVSELQSSGAAGSFHAAGGAAGTAGAAAGGAGGASQAGAAGSAGAGGFAGAGGSAGSGGSAGGGGSAGAGGAACLPVPDDLVSWWRAEGNGADATASANLLIAVGAAKYGPGEVGSAFWFDASTGYLQASDSASLDIASAITISAWINPTAIGGRIVDKITAGGIDGYMLDTYGGLRLIIDGSALNALTSPATGVWQHVAGTFDGMTLRVYRNGIEDGALTLSSPKTIPINALALRIGADSVAGSRFEGWIDEVQIYRRALLAEEILALYGAGAAGTCP